MLALRDTPMESLATLEHALTLWAQATLNNIIPGCARENPYALDIGMKRAHSLRGVMGVGKSPLDISDVLMIKYHYG